MRTAVIYEGAAGTPVDTDGTVVVGVAADGVLAAAERLVADGAERVELCGGLGPLPQAEVMVAVGDRVPVGSVLFGFESLVLVADFKRRFAGGEELHEAYLYLDGAAPPEGRRVDADGNAFVGVPDDQAAAGVASRLAAEGVALIELYGGLGPSAVAAVVAATDGQVPVGAATYPG